MILKTRPNGSVERLVRLPQVRQRPLDRNPKTDVFYGEVRVDGQTSHMFELVEREGLSNFCHNVRGDCFLLLRERRPLPLYFLALSLRKTVQFLPSSVAERIGNSWNALCAYRASVLAVPNDVSTSHLAVYNSELETRILRVLVCTAGLIRRVSRAFGFATGFTGGCAEALRLGDVGSTLAPYLTAESGLARAGYAGVGRRPAFKAAGISSRTANAIS